MAMSGRFYPDTFNGNVFIGSTAVAGVKPGAYNATAHTYCIWNPLGSGKNIVPIYTDIGYSDTTSAAGNLGLSYQLGVGSQVATGAAITAATLVAPLNAFLGGAPQGPGSIAKFAPATITFGSATSYLLTFGFSQLVTTAATTSQIGWTWRYVYDGAMIVPPGVAICVSGNTAPLSNLDITTYWAEVPQSG